MKVSKAIEILSDHDNLVLVFKNPDLHASVKLGIEAMKELQQVRVHSVGLTVDILPGETPEEKTNHGRGNSFRN